MEQIWGKHWSCEANNQYSHFPDRPDNTHPQRKRKDVLIKFFLPTGSRDDFALCCRVHSQWDRWVSVRLPLIDCGGLLTSSLVLLRLYPQFTAMSKGCISVQPSAVQVLERLPGEGDVRHKDVKATQQIAADFSFICPPSWFKIGPTTHVLLLWDIQRHYQWPHICWVTAKN